MILIFFAGLMVYAIGAQYYRISVSQTQLVNEQGVCQKVTNNGNQDIFIPTNTSNEWSLFRQNKPSYISLAECYLINNNHTEADCTNSGGGVVDDGGGNKMCKFNGGSCPGGWTQNGSWSETANKYCKGGSIDLVCLSGADCNTGSHGFSNTGRESCRYYDYSLFVPATCFSRQCFPDYPCGVSCSWKKGCKVRWCSGPCVDVPYPCGGSCQFGNGKDCYADTTSVGCY